MRIELAHIGNRAPPSARRGFTLVELMLAFGIGMFGVATAFSFAHLQLNSFAQQEDINQMQNSAQAVVEGLGRDIRQAGVGSAFYVGMEKGTSGFSRDTAILDSANRSRGFPVLRISNKISSPATVMPESDALMILRVTSEPAKMQDRLPCNPGASTYRLDSSTQLNLSPCLSRAEALILVSDSSRPTSEPQSMLLVMDGPASTAAGGDTIVLRAGWGIDPSAASRCTDGSNPPLGVGAGSAVYCVSPTTYWIDNSGRLRMWQPTTGAEAAAATLATGSLAGRPTSVPINPALDGVLAEGVEDLQIAARLSADATLPSGAPNSWILAGDPVDSLLTDMGVMAEARLIRVTALLRTTHAHVASASGREGVVDARIEDHTLPPNYDRKFVRKLVRFEADLRNMRLFDALSSSNRGWNDMRSY